MGVEFENVCISIHRSSVSPQPDSKHGQGRLIIGSVIFGAGYVLGGSLTAVALLVSTTHFCIPSLIYNTVAGVLRKGS